MKRIRNKIAILVAGGIFITLFPLAFVVIQSLEQQAVEDLKQEALLIAEFLSDAVSASVDLADGESVKSAMERMTDRETLVFVRVYDAEGELLASYQDEQVTVQHFQTHAVVPQSFAPSEGVVLALSPISSPIDPEEQIGTFVLGVSAAPLEERIRRFRLAGGAISLLVFLVGNIIAWAIGANIAQPVSRLSDVARKIADGDLAQTMMLPKRTSDEIGELAQAFDYMRKNLRDIISHIRNAGLKMHTSTDDIFMAVNQLVAALEQQSASVHETTMTMESMTATSRQISGNTEAVVTMADQTRTLSQKGTAVAEETIRKMQDIHDTNQQFLQRITALGERSENIGDVIQIIHDIADRTKLIAFNAALEAVGAKDVAGKRFNVVAVEIRRLADTIIESTQEIETNILEIQKGTRELVSSSGITTTRISEGVQHTETTADGLREILDAAVRTTDEAKQIALATQAQQLANEQILQALKEISNGTKQFVDASNQVSKSANEMKILAEAFQDLINQFELEPQVPPV